MLLDMKCMKKRGSGCLQLLTLLILKTLFPTSSVVLALLEFPE